MCCSSDLFLSMEVAKHLLIHIHKISVSYTRPVKLFFRLVFSVEVVTMISEAVPQIEI